jgi:hypothetical protein
MGRKLFKSDTLLFLGSGITFADFHTSGKQFVLMHKLYMYVMESTMYGNASLRRKVLVLSSPMDFLFFRLLIYLPTS